MTWDNLDSGSKTANIKTVDNVSLVSFAKNNYWNNDLYSYQVAPYLRVPLYVETWRCGCTLPNFYKNVPPKAIHDNQMVDISIWKNKQAVKIGASGYCSRYNNLKYPYPPYDTINVTGITIKVSIINKIFKYKYTNDHSKWAISQDKRYPWVFIGDINRQGPHSQWVRGGGGIAIENTSLWSFFKEIISDTEPQSIIL